MCALGGWLTSLGLYSPTESISSPLSWPAVLTISPASSPWPVRRWPTVPAAPTLSLPFVLNQLTPFWNTLCLEMLFQPAFGLPQLLCSLGAILESNVLRADRLFGRWSQDRAGRGVGRETERGGRWQRRVRLVSWPWWATDAQLYWGLWDRSTELTPPTPLAQGLRSLHYFTLHNNICTLLTTAPECGWSGLSLQPRSAPRGLAAAPRGVRAHGHGQPLYVLREGQSTSEVGIRSEDS